jgi:hypothetical protein
MALYHNVNSGDNIPYTAIVIKAVANWEKSKISLHYAKKQMKVLMKVKSEL